MGESRPGGLDGSASRRVAFLLQGERVPAARARGLALLPALAAAGLSCVASAPYPSVYGDTRLPWPLNRARQLYVPWSFVKRFGEVRALRSAALGVFQRPVSEPPTLALERAAAGGRGAVRGLGYPGGEARPGAGGRGGQQVGRVSGGLLAPAVRGWRGAALGSGTPNVVLVP